MDETGYYVGHKEYSFRIINTQTSDEEVVLPEDGESTEQPQIPDDSVPDGSIPDDSQPVTEDAPVVAEPQLPGVGIQKTISTGKYKITVSSANCKEVTLLKLTNSKKKSFTIPATVKIDGYSYNVTEIAPKAFKNNSKLKSVTIGKNVKKIGKEAFSGCKNLKKITIKSTVLKSVGKNAIKGIYGKATIKVPKKQLAKYKKLFKSKTGFKKSMKVKR